MTKPTLTDFLLARIAEDEEAAREMTRAVMRGETPPRMGFPTYLQGYLQTQSPARVFDECEAKRRIIDAHRRQVEDDDEAAWIVASGALLKALALPYADHDDYRDEDWGAPGRCADCGWPTPTGECGRCINEQASTDA